MRTKTILFCLAILSQFVQAQDTSNVRHYFGIKVLAKHHDGLNAFNSELKNNGDRPLGLFGWGFGVDYGLNINGFCSYVDFRYNSTGNDAKANELKVSLIDLNIEWDFGYDLLHRNEELDLELFAGFGLNLPQLSLQKGDSTFTVNQLLGGAKNMYFEQSKASFYVCPSVRLQYHLGKDDQFCPLIEAGYQLAVSNLKWSVADLPVQKLNGLLIMAGFTYTIGKK